MLLDRGAEWRTLSGALARAATGRGISLMLTGARGLGFTALLEELQRSARAAPADWVVLEARGAPDETGLDHALLHQVSSRLLGELDGDLAEGPRAALEAAIGLRVAHPGRVPVPMAMLAALEELGRRCPVLITVDDAHWADPASAAVLRFMNRRVARIPVCIVLVVPKDANASKTGLENGEDAAADSVLTLAPLADVDAGGWLDVELPSLDPVHRSAIVRLAAGRPRHLADLIQLVRSSPEGRPLPIGAALPSAARARELLSGLPESTRRALVAYGLIDDPAAEPLVERVSGGAARQVITRAASRELLRDPFLAAVAVEEAPSGLVAALRTKWAEQLEAAPASAAPAAAAVRQRAEAARQRVLGMTGPDPRLAVRAGAAARALRAVDAQRSGELFELAAAVHEDHAARASDLLQAAELAWASGRTERSLELVALAGAYGQLPSAAAGIDQARGTAARHRALEALAAGDRSAAAEHLRDALVHLVAAVRHGGEPQEAVATGTALVLVAGRRNSQVAAVIAACAALPAAHAQQLRSVARLGLPWELARPDEQRRALLDCVVVLSGSGLPLMRLVADAGRLLGGEQDVTAACWRLLDAWPPSGPAAVDLHLALAASYLDLDGVRVARQHVHRAREALKDASGAEDAVGQAEMLLERLADDRVPAPLVGDAPALPLTAETAGAVWSRSHLYRLRGDFAAAAAELARLWPDPGEPAPAGALLHALPYVYALRESGAASEQLRQVQGQVSAWAAGSGATAAIVTDLVCQATTATTRTAALTLLERAVAVADTTDSAGTTSWGAAARLALGMALRRARQSAAAREPLAAALDTFTDLGQLAFAELTRRELGATAPQRPARSEGSSALTAQERSVASLAADGLTNADIALSLGISARTVAHHLQHVYAKLGIKGRRQLSQRLQIR